MVDTRVLLLDEPFQGVGTALANAYAKTLWRVRAERKDLALLITETSSKLLRRIADAALPTQLGGFAPADLPGL
jgi:branched-chain amino acid transport system ATP-binding protein